MDHKNPRADARRQFLHATAQRFGMYMLIFLKWLAIGVFIGAIGGAVGIAFHVCIERAVGLREARPWLLYLLPAGGLVIALLYRGVRVPLSTDNVITAVRSDAPIHPMMAPLIFVCTVITHLLGGSAGCEGAAVQLGGCIGYRIGRALRLDTKDSHVIVMCGISAVFSAVFSTPLAAAIFAMEVISVGNFYYVALVPCVAAAMTANALAALLGIEGTAFAAFTVPALGFGAVGGALLVGLCCAGASILFCVALHRGEKLTAKAVKNPYLRVALGGAAVIALTKLSGGMDYNGAGMNLVQSAVAGQSPLPAFLWKLVFTVVTISCGYKGGEIVPSMAIGATLGCAVGQIIGLEPGFCAAVGLVAMFCGMVNCPLSAMFIGLELFGAGAMPYFAVACAVSYMLSGNYSLYGSQRIVYSKLKAEYINTATH